MHRAYYQFQSIWMASIRLNFVFNLQPISKHAFHLLSFQTVKWTFQLYLETFVDSAQFDLYNRVEPAFSLHVKTCSTNYMILWILTILKQYKLLTSTLSTYWKAVELKLYWWIGFHFELKLWSDVLCARCCSGILFFISKIEPWPQMKLIKVLELLL